MSHQETLVRLFPQRAVREQRDERGITLVLFALTIVVVVMILSLVIDLGKQQLTLTQIRQAADAAALSGARQLNGRADGWRSAKLAATLVLRRYPIHGVDHHWQEKIKLTTGDAAFWDFNPPNAAEYNPGPLEANIGTTGKFAAYQIKIERGVIRAREDDPRQMEFVSLEASPEGEFMSSDAYLFANALRVEAKLDSLPGIFTRIFGVLGFSDLQARSYAVMDSTLQRLVAPVAISLQDLMLDTNPQTFSESHQSPWYEPELEYGRELEIGVLNKTGRSDLLNVNPELDRDPLEQTNPRAFIDEGITRYRSFTRLPYAHFESMRSRPGYPPDICYQGAFSGIGQNCKGVPIEGYFAMPGVDTVTPEMVVEALESGGVRAKVGDIVTGLTNLGNLSLDQALATRLGDIINNGEVSFKEFFTEGENVPRPNYPFLRTTRKTEDGSTHFVNPAGEGEFQDPQYRPDYRIFPTLIGSFTSDVIDLILTYPSAQPTEAGTMPVPQRFLMGEMSMQAPGNPPVQDKPSGAGQLNFLNPMCHFDSVPVNNLEKNRVKEVYAMVVAPRKNVTEHGQKVNYRDFASMFSGAGQQAIAPVKETVPTVVGFVKIGIFDGNTLALNVRFPVAELPPLTSEFVHVRTSTPHYGSASQNNYVVDDNPAFLDLSNSPLVADMKSYVGKVQNAYDCFDKNPNKKDECEPPPPPPPLDPVIQLLQCFDFSFLEEELESVVGDLADFVNARNCCIADAKVCGIAPGQTCPGCAEGSGCCQRICFGTGKDPTTVEKLAEVLERGLAEPVRAFPHTHCLYNLRPDSDNMNDVQSYEPLHPLTAGFGCAGLRGRLAIIERPRESDYVSLVSGTLWSRQAPALVNVKETPG